MDRAALRAFRWLGWGLAALAVAGLAMWLGTAYWISDQLPEDLPFWTALRIVGPMLWGSLVCSVTGCSPEPISGTRLRVFAGASLLRYTPVAIDVDEWGRVYVAESDRINGGAEDNRFRDWLDQDLASRTVDDRVAYYREWIDRGVLPPDWFTARSDHLTLIADEDGDGAADLRRELTSFAEIPDGLAAGVLVHEGEAWVTAIPGLYQLRDSDGDRIPDARRTLATGFGVKTSLLGHDLHGLAWGPDGKLYFSVGDRGYHVDLGDRVLEPPLGPGRGAVLRVNPDGSGLEVFATGLRNPQELAFDDFGNLFTGDNNGDGGDLARIVYVVEGGDSGWAMPYQTLFGDYLRGPWNAEKLWHTAHSGQPAWIVPPIAHLTNGPAGMAAYPGLGLPERYRGYFFLCDYRYQPQLSGVWSFAVEPAGAGFEMVDEHVFLASTLATDLAFGYDGRLFVSEFDQFGATQQLLTLVHESSRADPRVAETVRLVRQGLQDQPTPELADLLGHADRRVRQRAQRELVRRGAGEVLARVARDRQAGLLPRLHAVWGLGQLGAEGLRSAGWEDLGWLAGNVDEFRAQVARVAGEAGAGWLEPDLIALLRDPNARVRFFAAQSLGRLRAGGAIPELVELLRANADADPFLRHAAVYALYRIGDVEALLADSADASAAVRRGVLLALRHAADPRIGRFLRDPDPSLVAEAARAIYDGPIPEAFGELAELAGSELPDALREPDPQTSGALQRRAIGASLALGRPEDALRLAAHAADPANPLDMRRLALDSLADFPRPPARDLAMGFHRPLPERDPAPVQWALERHGPALIHGELGARALEVATAFDRLTLPDAELGRMLEDDSLDPRRRVAALRALDSRGSAEPFIGPALASRHAALRSEARERLARTRPAAAIEALRAIPETAPLAERQHGLRLLARISEPAAERLLVERIGDLRSGRLDPGLTLDLIEAARAHGGASVAAALADWEGQLLPGDPVERRAYALAGGEPERGREVFEGAGDCLRCHGTGGHGGGGAGPALAGVFERRGARHVLQSLLEPWAEIAPGFAGVSVTQRNGDRLSGTLVSESDVELVLEVDGRERRIPVAEIESRGDPTSGMPATGLTLAPAELRDLVAYVATL